MVASHKAESEEQPEGASLTDYLLLTALITVSSLVTISLLGPYVQKSFQRTADSLAGASVLLDRYEFVHEGIGDNLFLVTGECGETATFLEGDSGRNGPVTLELIEDGSPSGITVSFQSEDPASGLNRLICDQNG